MPKYKVIEHKDVPPQLGCIGGFSFQSFVVDTDVYLQFLLNQFTNEGGKLKVKELSNNAEVFRISIKHSSPS
jgi:hypothetical protein